MWTLFSGALPGSSWRHARRHIVCLEAELEALQIEACGMEELAGHLDAERNLLLAATDRLRPNMPEGDLLLALMELVFRPFDLGAFYVAKADWTRNLVTFPIWKTGGRMKEHADINLRDQPGLVGRTILAGESRYIPEISKEGLADVSHAEVSRGVLLQSWYGVVMHVGPCPWGLVCFQAFQPDAFSDARRDLMQAMVRILTLSLEAGSYLLKGDRVAAPKMVTP